MGKMLNFFKHGSLDDMDPFSNNEFKDPKQQKQPMEDIELEKEDIRALIIAAYQTILPIVFLAIGVFGVVIWAMIKWWL